MGVSVEQWRAAIGSYNARKACSLAHSFSSSQASFLLSMLCFVAATLQQAVMTALMLLILLSGDVERNPGPLYLDDKPTLLRLLSFPGKAQHFNVAERIGEKYFVVGVELLNDENGVKVQNIESKHRGNTAINTNILCDWLQDTSHSDCTWRRLLSVLRVHCPQLARDIEETLVAEEGSSTSIQEPPAKKSKDSTVDKLLAEQSSGSSSAAKVAGLTPTQQPPTLSQLSDELRARYAKYPLPHFSSPQSIKWIPHVSKKYIHPNLVRKEDQEDQHMRAVLQRGCHSITEEEEGSDEPIKLAEFFSIMPWEEGCEVVLVEGAPGIGKSTLAWQVCHLWGKRELFHQYSTVLLLPLRDERVQEAKQVKDFFFHIEDEKARDKAKQCMGTGFGTLLIFDGLDELPDYLLSQRSIFTDLLSGEVLGDATILVTSRPSATQQLRTRWKQRISKHFVIHGFSEKNIESYIQSILSGEKLKEFQEYLSIHPHIQSFMYVPLHSAIVMAVYMQYKKLPKTITKVYKWLVRIILNQYLNDHSKCTREEQVYDKILNLTLPSQVYTKFKELCRVAFDNICNRKLIFGNLPEELHKLGFTDSVPELFLPGSSSYNFLHVTVQEFLAAYHVSQMIPSKQETLLLRSREEHHLRNMMRFIAGLTKFESLKKEVLQNVIKVPQLGAERFESLEGFETDLMPDQDFHTPREASLDSYSVELLYECQNVSALDSENTYKVHLRYHSLHHNLAIGYCISNSKCTWRLELGLWKASGLAMFIHGLTDSNPQPGYTIKYIRIGYGYSIDRQAHMCESSLKFLLPRAPGYFLAHIKHLELVSEASGYFHACIEHLDLESKREYQHSAEDITQLCQWLRTSTCRLETLSLSHPQADHIEMVSEAINEVTSLTTLRLDSPEFTLQSMQIFASMLRDNYSLTEVNIHSSIMKILDDDCVCCLAEALHNNTTLRKLDIKHVGQRGAEALQKLHEHRTTLEVLYTYGLMQTCSDNPRPLLPIESTQCS